MGSALTPKVRKIIACWAVLRGLGLLLLPTFGS